MNDAMSLADALRDLRGWCASDPAAVSGRGLEAVIAGATLAVSKKTWLLPGRRERGCALVRGCPPDRLDAARPYRVVPPGPSPIARALQAVGLAMDGDPSLVFLGTGSVSYGGFTEALSLAALRRVPTRFVVSWYENAGPFAPQLGTSPARLAEAFGLAAREVDGSDVDAVYQAVAGLGEGGLVLARLHGRA